MDSYDNDGKTLDMNTICTSGIVTKSAATETVTFSISTDSHNNGPTQISTQTTNSSNDIFIASGPYFARYSSSDDESKNYLQPSTSNVSNCNVVFSNIENLERELCTSAGNCSKAISKNNETTICSNSNESNKIRVAGLKKFLQPFSGSNSNKSQELSSLKQTKQLSSSTVEMSMVGSLKNAQTKENRQTLHSQSALEKLLSTSQELFHSKSKHQQHQHQQQQHLHHHNNLSHQQSQHSSHTQPTLLSIASSTNVSQTTSHALTVPSTSSSSLLTVLKAPPTDRPRSSYGDYNDLQTVPEDYKSAFQQVFSKKSKILSSNKLLNKRHNRSKSLSQNFDSSPTGSEDENCVQGSMIRSQMIDDEPIHMTLEEVKAMMTTKCSRHDENSKQTMKKSKLKQAFQHLLHKTHCITNIQSGPSSSKSDNLSSHPPVVLESFENCSRTSGKIDLNIDLIPSTSSAPPPISPFGHRALPPVPKRRETIRQMRKLDSLLSFKMKNMTFEEREKYLLYLDSITRVKQCGWYWGPVSGEMAEKLLQNEPCGSFIVRDSSDEHYIFSLTFKLNGLIRHVRIEHDHGNFSFGPGRKYKNNTIVEFIEGAVEHSRNGQFLFFLHRIPIDGPDGVLRIQLLNPVSRFRSMQSLQHACRFAILKLIRRDQIHFLDVPDMIKIYLDTPFYFSEELEILHDGPPPLSDQVRWIVTKKRQHFLRLLNQTANSEH